MADRFPLPSERGAKPLTTMIAARRISGAMLAVWTCVAAPASSAQTVSFQRDVMAVLSKAGCNAGKCHGALHGKGGFKLSLRGENPAEDFRTLTRDGAGRRTDPLAPRHSLLLLKPTLAIAHEGGRRFAASDPEYRILHDWIAAGMPADPCTLSPLAELKASPSAVVVDDPATTVQLSIQAVFADGHTRDVTQLAVYEPTNGVVDVAPDGMARRRTFGETTVLVRYLDRQTPVRLTFLPRRDDFVWRDVPSENYIDRHVLAKLRSLRMQPTELCDDSTFVRRVFLDVCGVLPTADEAREFVADKHPAKRSRLVDALLARPEFADRAALAWADLLRCEEKVLDSTGVKAYHGWIRRAMADGMPLDRFVKELLTASGSTYQAPATNFYRALRDPIARGEAVAQVFLGARLQCAKCHNHPFDRWTQEEYYRWAAVFARIDYKIIANERRDKLDKHEFVGEQIVLHIDKGTVTMPGQSRTAAPKLLGGGEVSAAAGGQRLATLGDWLTDSKNRRFVETQANRVWAQLMGRGLVDPIDDLRETNPASHPELLTALADDLIANNFDHRQLVRRIVTSRAYQASSTTGAANVVDGLDALDGAANYARATVRRLSAEQLFDALHQALDVPPTFNGFPVGTRAGQMPGVQAVRERRRRMSDEEQFLKTFGKPGRLLVCDCERSQETTLAQSFALIGGQTIQDVLTRPNNRLSRLAASGMTHEQAVDELYWSVLTRAPAAAERSAAVAILLDSADRLPALQDLAWALLNAKEFVFRH